MEPIREDWIAEPRAWESAQERFRKEEKRILSIPLSDRSITPSPMMYSGPWQHLPSGVITWNFYYLTKDERLAVAKAYLKKRSIPAWSDWKTQGGTLHVNP